MHVFAPATYLVGVRAETNLLALLGSLDQFIPPPLEGWAWLAMRISVVESFFFWEGGGGKGDAGEGRSPRQTPFVILTISIVHLHPPPL